MEEVGGFPSELFVTPPNEIFNCSICLNVAREPMRCPDEHIFCKSCITRWLSRKTFTCPNDRKFLDCNALSVFRTADALLGDYCMRCTASLPREKPLSMPNKYRKGKRIVKRKIEYISGICDWVGKLNDFSSHKKCCREMLAKCPHPDCLLWFLGRDLAPHAAKCKHRLEACKHCGKLRKPAKRSIHRKRCLKREVRCRSPHCKVMLPRQDMAAHYEVCPLAIVRCPYAVQLNCKYQCTRADMHKHTEDRFSHLEVTTKKMDELERRAAINEDKIYSQEMLIQTLCSDLRALQDEMALKNRRMEWLERQGVGRLREGVPW